MNDFRAKQQEKVKVLPKWAGLFHSFNHEGSCIKIYNLGYKLKLWQLFQGKSGGANSFGISLLHEAILNWLLKNAHLIGSPFRASASRSFAWANLASRTFGSRRKRPLVNSWRDEDDALISFPIRPTSDFAIVAKQLTVQALLLRDVHDGERGGRRHDGGRGIGQGASGGRIAANWGFKEDLIDWLH